MQIQLNGESRNIPDHSSAQNLVELLELTGKRLAMEVNREIVPRTTYAQHSLHEGDHIEIVHAIGGG
ncbi:MAG: sulfur carrier protein ThiS [Gammaproteobacteria bacterium]|nr:sulfur carrier protein ThiS [Gammaproteobacteria bacterium]